MKHADWIMISRFGYILGGLSTLGALFALLYSEQNFLGWRTYPYNDLVIPLLIAGIVLMVIGYITDLRAKEEIQK